MLEMILEDLGGEIRRVAGREGGVVRGAGGVGGFVQGVLVMECGVRLVGEDMGVGAEGKEGERVRQEVREGAGVVGELVNGEVEDEEERDGEEG